MLNNSSFVQERIRIFLVDHQVTFCEALRLSLKDEPDFEIVGSASDKEIALTQITHLHPDITLLGTETSGIDELAIIQQIKQQVRNSKVVILSHCDQPDLVQRALLAGVRGYLMKVSPVDELAQAIRLVYKGYLQLGPGLLEKLDVDDVSLQPQGYPGSGDSLADVEGAAGKPSSASEEGWSAIAQEHMDSLPRVWTRGLFYFIFLLTATLLPWVILSRVDETGTARGRLEPRGETIRLDAPAAGMVTDVHVQEGQPVKAGQVLMEIDSSIQRNELQQAQARLESQRDRLTQMEGQKTQLAVALNTQAQQNQAQILEKQAQVDQAQLALNGVKKNAPLQLAEKRSQVGQAQQNLQAAKTAYKLANQRWQKDQEEGVKPYYQLWRERVVSKTKLNEVQRVADESKQLRNQALATIQQATGRLQEEQSNEQKLGQQIKSEIQQATSRVAEQQASFQSLRRSGELALLKSWEQLQQLQTEITNLRADIQQSSAQINALQLQIRQRVLKSPATGTIFQLPVKRAKVFVQAGQLMAQVAPQGSTLILKAQIPNQDRGFLKVGMAVKLKFDAYRFQDYGIVPGRLQWIAPDSKMIETGSGQEEIFEVEVELDQSYIQARHKRTPLVAGLTATAEVIIQQRRVIDLILDPFRQLGMDGLKL
jgi:hemolysin D